MNFEQMIQRCLVGLSLAQDKALTQVGAHGFLLFVFGATEDDFTESERETLADNGWAFDIQMGLVFPTIS